jgi:hypothetical protein
MFFCLLPLAVFSHILFLFLQNFGAEGNELPAGFKAVSTKEFIISEAVLTACRRVSYQ